MLRIHFRGEERHGPNDETAQFNSFDQNLRKKFSTEKHRNYICPKATELTKVQLKRWMAAKQQSLFAKSIIYNRKVLEFQNM